MALYVLAKCSAPLWLRTLTCFSRHFWHEHAILCMVLTSSPDIYADNYFKEWVDVKGAYADKGYVSKG